MSAYKNILLTTDLSSNADSAIPYAVALAKRHGGTIHLFHVLEDEAREALAAGIVIGVTEWIANLHKHHTEKVAAMAQRIEKDSGIKTIYAVVRGNPAKEVATYAKKFDVDIVVIATHGRTGLVRFLLGSVAERVVRLSPAPVLTVRPGAIVPNDGLHFRAILLPTDFSENAAVVQPFAVELAREAGAKLLLVHVVEDSVYYASAAAGEGIGVDVEAWLTTICAEAEKRLHSEAAALSAKSGLEVVPIMSRGRAAERLVELATEHHADLMVISTHGYTGLSHLIFGSVAERIVRISHVPVLSIKPQKVAEHAQSMLS